MVKAFGTVYEDKGGYGYIIQHGGDHIKSPPTFTNKATCKAAMNVVIRGLNA